VGKIILGENQTLGGGLPGDNKKVNDDDDDDDEVLTYVWAKLRWQLGLAKGVMLKKVGE
jgi:hypothetical protein